MKRVCNIVEDDQSEADQTEDDSVDDAEAIRREVMFATYQKWRHDFDIEFENCNVDEL